MFKAVLLAIGAAATIATASAGPSADGPTPAGHWDIPKSETAYIAVIRKAQPRYDAADNELKKSTIKREMMADIRAALGRSAAVENWEGTLVDFGTSRNGDAWIAIEIAPGIIIATWNNDISDAGVHTLIKNGTISYKILSGAKPGQHIMFSGQLLGIGNLTEAGSVDSPKMIARFSNLLPMPWAK